MFKRIKFYIRRKRDERLYTKLTYIFLRASVSNPSFQDNFNYRKNPYNLYVGLAFKAIRGYDYSTVRDEVGILSKNIGG